MKILKLISIVIFFYVAKKMHVMLPGHGMDVSHLFKALSSPGQCLPPCIGAGLLHSRDLRWVPIPHVTEHIDQSNQSLQPPSTD